MDRNPAGQIPVIGDGTGIAPPDTIYPEELQLALRNRGMPLEALQYPITPTGLHYLFVHFDIPFIDTRRWRLNVGGFVGNPITLSLNELRDRPSITLPVTMECAGNGSALLTPRPTGQPWMLEGIGTSQWTGTPLAGLLEETRVREGAVEVLFTGIDHGVQGGKIQYYQRSLSIEDATRPEVILAYEMNGEPLQPQHGYPLRLIVPGWYGMTCVKWLESIQIITTPFNGNRMTGNSRSNRAKDGPGEPVTRIRVRALIVPPGIPDSMTRSRLVTTGLIQLTGRAWAGELDVARVEVSTGGGESWEEAELGERVSAYGWHPWSHPWHAAPGKHVIRVRATDSQGNLQPSTQPDTYQGSGNNMVQCIEVTVE